MSYPGDKRRIYPPTDDKRPASLSRKREPQKTLCQKHCCACDIRSHPSVVTPQETWHRHSTVNSIHAFPSQPTWQITTDHTEGIEIPPGSSSRQESRHNSSVVRRPAPRPTPTHAPDAVPGFTDKGWSVGQRSCWQPSSHDNAVKGRQGVKGRQDQEYWRARGVL